MPPAIDYRQTFLRWHIPTELDPPFEQETGFREEVLALDSLRHRLRQSFPDAATDIHRLVSRRRFFLNLPDTPWLYLPVRVRRLPDGDRGIPPGEPDDYADLTDLLASTTSSRRNVLLTARSGAGKSTAILKAYFDCLVGRDPALGGWLPCYLRRVHSPRKAFVQARKRQAANHEVVLDLIAEAAKLPTSPSAERLEQWLSFSPPLLLFLDLNAASDELRGLLAEAIVRFQEHFEEKHRWVVAYRSAGRDEMLNYFTQTGRFASYDLRHLEYTDAEKYFVNLQLVESDLTKELALRHTQTASRPLATAPIDPTQLRELFDRYGSTSDALISTPLLMHFVSVIGIERATKAESLAQLYEEVVEDYLDRDYGRLDGRATTPYAEVVRRSGLMNPAGRTKIKVAMARVALATLAGSDTRLQPRPGAPVEELVDRLLRDPKGFTDPNWCPPDSWWHVGRYYHEQYDEPACRALREFSFLRRDGDAFGFLHDSFLYYFAALAMRCRNEPPPALCPLNVQATRVEWCRKAVERMHLSAKTWQLPALFLGGMLKSDELQQILLEALVQEPRPGWPGVVKRLLQGHDTESVGAQRQRTKAMQHSGVDSFSQILFVNRHEGRAPVLDAIERALLGAWSQIEMEPQLLFTEAYEQLSSEGLHTDDEQHRMARRLRERMPRPWIRRCQPRPYVPVMTMAESDQAVIGLAVLNGAEIVSVDAIGTVRVWKPGNREVRTLPATPEQIVCLAASTANRLATGGDDGTVRLWDETLNASRIVGKHDGAIRVLAFLSKNRLASGGDDQSIRIWCLDRSNCLARLDYSGLQADMWNSPLPVQDLKELDETRIVLVASGGTQIWDYESEPNGGTTLPLDSGHDGPAFLAVLPGGCIAMLCAGLRYVQLWASPDYLEKQESPTDIGGQGMAKLAEGRVAVVTKWRYLQVFDNSWSAPPPRPLPWHQGEVTTFAALPNGCLAVACSDGAVRVVNPEEVLQHEEQALPAAVQAVSVLTDGALVVARSDGTVQIRENDGKQSPTVTLRRNPVPILSRFPSRRLGDGGVERTVRIYRCSAEAVRPLPGSIACVHDLALLDDGLIVANHDGAQVWPPDFGMPLNLPNPVGIKVLEPFGVGRFAAGCEDGVVRIWDIRQRTFAELTGHKTDITALLLLPPYLLASCDSEGFIRLWNLIDSTGQLLGNHKGWVNALSKLGEKYLVSAGQDHTLRLWPIDGHSRGQVLNSPERVTAMKRLRDGRLVLGDAQGVVSIFDAHDETHEETVLYRHPDSVELLDVMPDGRIVSADGDGLVKVWDIGLRQGWVLRTAMSRPKALEILGDGRVAIAGSESLRVWHVDQDELWLSKELTGIQHMRLVSTGHLAIATMFDQIHLYELPETQDAVQVELPPPGVHRIRELPDHRLALTCTDGTVQLFDRSGNRLQILEENANAVRDLVTTHNGWLVSAPGRTVAFWNLERKVGGAIPEPADFLAELNRSRLLYAAWNRIGVFSFNTSTYQSVALVEKKARSFTILGQLPVLGTEHGEVWVREGDDGTCQPFEGHEGPVHALIALSAELIVSAGEDGSVRFWSLRAGAMPSVGHEDSQPVLALARLPTGGVASASVDGSVRLWKEDGTHDRLLGTQPGWVRCLEPLSEGRLTSAGKDGAIRVWDLSASGPPLVLDGHKDAVLVLCHFRDDQLLSGGRDGRILCWDMRPGGCHRMRELVGHQGWVQDIVPINERWIASSASDETVRLWNIDSEETHVLKVGYSATTLQLLADGQLAVGTSGKSVQVWDVHRRECATYLEVDGTFVTGMALLADRHLVVGTRDGLLTVHGLEGGDEHRLGGHRGQINALATLPDHRIVSAGADGRVLVWQLGQPRTRLVQRHSGEIGALTVLSGRLVSASDDGIIKVWDPKRKTTLVHRDGRPVSQLLAMPDERRFLAVAAGKIDWFEVVEPLADNAE